MEKRIYVGNLSFGTQEDALRALFEPYGDVESVNIITDRQTGRSKGFGFIEMADPQSARDAIAALDGGEFEGRNLRVNEARPRPSSYEKKH